MTITVPSGCPRCACIYLTGSTGWTAGCEWAQTSCNDCGHRWGDGLPDSQDRPLPDGCEDCPMCDGSGDQYGRRCAACGGEGIWRRGDTT